MKAAAAVGRNVGDASPPKRRETTSFTLETETVPQETEVNLVLPCTAAYYCLCPTVCSHNTSSRTAPSLASEPCSYPSCTHTPHPCITTGIRMHHHSHYRSRLSLVSSDPSFHQAPAAATSAVATPPHPSSTVCSACLQTCAVLSRLRDHGSAKLEKLRALLDQLRLMLPCETIPHSIDVASSRWMGM